MAPALNPERVALRFLRTAEAQAPIGPGWGITMQERMFSRPVQREIIKRFKSPQSQGFFQLYVELFQSYRNGELLSPVFPRYATAIRFVRRFLASEAAGFITGVSLPIDGAATAD